MLQDLAPLPEFSGELVGTCTTKRDAMPLAFEWYKHTATLAVQLACLSSDTTGYRLRPSVHQAVMRGLLNRCARLMLSTVRLASEAKWTETITILLRCIVESAVKVTWLSDDSAGTSRFDRYVSDSLRQDLELKKLIERNIEARGGKPQTIETRMLGSIERCRRAAQKGSAGVREGRMPSFEQILLEASYDDSLYTIVQRMGSHSVHGTWTDLLTFYVEEAEGRFAVRDAPGPAPHAAHLVLPARMVLDALVNYVIYMVAHEALRRAMHDRAQVIADGMRHCVEIEAGGDFDVGEV